MKWAVFCITIYSGHTTNIIFLHAPTCLLVNKFKYLKKGLYLKSSNVPTKFRLTCAEGWLSQCVTTLGSLCNIPHQSLNVVSAELCQAQSWKRTSWEKNCVTVVTSLFIWDIKCLRIAFVLHLWKLLLNYDQNWRSKTTNCSLLKAKTI